MQKELKTEEMIGLSLSRIPGSYLLALSRTMGFATRNTLLTLKNGDA